MDGYQISQNFQFGMGLSPDKANTALKIIYNVQVQYENGTKIDFASALNQLEITHSKPGFSFFKELADDALPKLIQQFRRHADYELFGMQNKEIHYSDRDMEQMKLIIDLF